MFALFDWLCSTTTGSLSIYWEDDSTQCDRYGGFPSVLFWKPNNVLTVLFYSMLCSIWFLLHVKEWTTVVMIRSIMEATVDDLGSYFELLCHFRCLVLIGLILFCFGGFYSPQNKKKIKERSLVGGEIDCRSSHKMETARCLLWSGDYLCLSFHHICILNVVMSPVQI